MPNNTYTVQLAQSDVSDVYSMLILHFYEYNPRALFV